MRHGFQIAHDVLVCNVFAERESKFRIAPVELFAFENAPEKHGSAYVVCDFDTECVFPRDRRFETDRALDLQFHCDVVGILRDVTDRNTRGHLQFETGERRTLRNADNLCVDIKFHKDLFEFFDFFRKVFRNDVRTTFIEEVDGRRVIRFLLLF